MKKFYKTIYKRNNNSNLLLFNSNKQHSKKIVKELDITNYPYPHIRWHPFRQEWVTYSAGRKKRTFFPPKEYCPLCPSKNIEYPSEIPFNNFEIAVFPNRWPSFVTNKLIKTIT